MSEWTFTKSRYEKKNLSQSLKKVERDQQMNRKKFENAFGTDTTMGNINAHAEALSANQIFGEQMGKRQYIPEKTLKRKIVDTYHEAFGNKTVSLMTRGKRTEAAMNKLKLQDHLKEECETLSVRRQNEADLCSEYINMDMADSLALRYNSNAEKQALREWVIAKSGAELAYDETLKGYINTEDMITISYANYLTSDDKEQRLLAYRNILKVASSIDIAQFDYNSDREFVSSFGEKYDLLCKGSSALVFLKKFVEEGGGTLEDTICVADLEAKFELMAQYKRDYEQRMELLQSPYYALLSNEDMNTYLEMERKGKDMSHISPQFRAYMEKYKALSEGEIGKRKNGVHVLMNRQENDGIVTLGKQETKRQALCDEYQGRVRVNISGLEEMNVEQTGDELIRQRAEKKEAQLKEAYSQLYKDEYGLMENVHIEKGLGDIKPAELRTLEINVLEAIKNKSFGGKELDEKDFTELHADFVNMNRTRTEYVTLTKKLDHIMKLKSGLGCDFNNPTFMESREGKLLKKIATGGIEITAGLNESLAELEKTYKKSLTDLADKLGKKGFNVYSGEAEEIILKKTYENKPEMEENSPLALFDDALHTSSKKSFKKLDERKNAQKAGQKNLFIVFKKRFKAKNDDLPEDGGDLTAAEESQIRWVLHRLVLKENSDIAGIDDFRQLWNKKVAYEEKNGTKVSDRVKKNVSNMLDSWKESLEAIEEQKRLARERIAASKILIQQRKGQEGEKERQLEIDKKIKDHKDKEAALRAEYDERNKDKEKVSRDIDHWDEKIKGSYQHVLKLEDATKFQAVVLAQKTNDAIRERVINDELRKERRDLYMEYTEEERKALRDKKHYVLRKEKEVELRRRNRFGDLYNNSIRDVEEVLRKLKPASYTGIDKKRHSDDLKERTVELYHSEGTRLLEEEGHDVLEIDIGGSSYREFSRAHNGFLGYSEGDPYELHKMYGDKYYSQRNKKEMDYIRSKSRPGESEMGRGHMKTRFTIAGPSPETGGMNNIGEYSIGNTTQNILEIGSAYLEGIFKRWQAEDEAWAKEKNGDDPALKRTMVDVMLRGHSRGGIGSVMGSMKLNDWLHKNWSKYADKVKFHLIQYDPVPGGPSDWGGYEKVDHAAKSHTVRFDKSAHSIKNKVSDSDYLPLGENAETTTIYSMNTQYQSMFAAQEMRHAKRLIFTPFNHAVSLDVESTDDSQMDQEGEKLHAMTFYDTATGKAYRQSGLNQLNEGVYVMDEKHNLVKLDSVQEYIRIIQLTVPASELKEQAARHTCMLHAVASKFGIEDKEADKLWSDNLKNAEVKEAAENWEVYDAEHAVKKAECRTDEKAKEAISEALSNRKKVHDKFIDTKVKDENKKAFLKACTDMSLKIELVNHRIYKGEFVKAIDDMNVAMTRYEDMLKNGVKFDPKGMTDEESEIAQIARETRLAHLKAMKLISEENKDLDFVDLEDVLKNEEKNA